MDEKVERLAEDIKRTLGDAREWDRRKTNIPGIFLVRMPGEGLRVMLNFNPTGTGRRRGFFFADREDIDAARRAFPDERLDALVAAVEKVNGARGPKPAEDEEIFRV